MGIDYNAAGYLMPTEFKCAVPSRQSFGPAISCCQTVYPGISMENKLKCGSCGVWSRIINV